MPQVQSQGPRQFASGSVHHPPWFQYSLANIGVSVGLLANGWQGFTSTIAFFTMFTQGAVYKSLSSQGQGTASAAALIISIGLALSFQLGVLFFVFRLHTEYKEQQVKIGDTMAALKFTAVQMVSHHRLLLVWSALSFGGDTVGDFTFISLITGDPILMGMYVLSLYAVSTVILSASLERQWAAKIALENWRAFKAYIRLMSLKAQAATVSHGGSGNSKETRKLDS